MVSRIALVLLVGCTPTATTIDEQHPAHPNAPTGRLAGPPGALRSGAAEIEPKRDPLALETAAYEKAKPVFDKWCSKCHSRTGKSWTPKKVDHFDMTTYPFGGHHATEIGAVIRKSLGIDGGAPTMPADDKGAVRGDDLVLIKAWAEAFDTAHPQAAGHHH